MSSSGFVIARMKRDCEVMRSRCLGRWSEMIAMRADVVMSYLVLIRDSGWGEKTWERDVNVAMDLWY